MEQALIDFLQDHLLYHADDFGSEVKYQTRTDELSIYNKTFINPVVAVYVKNITNYDTDDTLHYKVNMIYVYGKKVKGTKCESMALDKDAITNIELAKVFRIFLNDWYSGECSHLFVNENNIAIK